MGKKTLNVMGMVMVLLLIGSVTLVSLFAGVLGLQLYISEDG